ncbi:MAG: hypothetical protein K6G57_06085 [Lachnospiraceae bacterium]|nr:hypothetical protein [Lachnospiraceae bacterium]
MADEYVMDPELENFLATSDPEERLDILRKLEPKADEKMLRMIAIALDLQYEDGASIDDKINAVRESLQIELKYEGRRLRS